MNLSRAWPWTWRTWAVLLSAGMLAIGALALGPLASSRTDVPPDVSMPEVTRLASIPVEGMVCLSCAAAIKQKVKALPGVLDAQVHFANRVVVVNYAASRADVPARAAAAINSLGYKAGQPTVGA